MKTLAYIFLAAFVLAATYGFIARSTEAVWAASAFLVLMNLAAIKHDRNKPRGTK